MPTEEVTTKVSDYNYLSKCCPIFNEEKWDERTHHWNHKHFIKASIPTFFHIPIPNQIGQKLKGLIQLAESSEKTLPDKNEMLILFNDPSTFTSDILMSVYDAIPNAQNVILSGTFLSKAFKGQYNEVSKFMKEMDALLHLRGEKANKYYVHYAYCPKCAKEAGHNFAVLFAQLNKTQLN